MKIKHKISVYYNRQEYVLKRHTRPPVKQKSAACRSNGVQVNVWMSPEEAFELDKFIYDYDVRPNSRSAFCRRAILNKIRKLRKQIKQPYKGRKS